MQGITNLTAGTEDGKGDGELEASTGADLDELGIEQFRRDTPNRFAATPFLAEFTEMRSQSTVISAIPNSSFCTNAVSNWDTDPSARKDTD